MTGFINCGKWINPHWLMLAGLLLVANSASAGMQEILEAVQSSEFRFSRSTSEVPFMPLGWTQDRYYPNSQFTDAGLPGAGVVENTASLGAVLPPYVGQRDMLFTGGDMTWDHITIKSGPYADQSVLRLTPVAGWLHQFDEEKHGRGVYRAHFQQRAVE